MENNENHSHGGPRPDRPSGPRGEGRLRRDGDGPGMGRGRAGFLAGNRRRKKTCPFCHDKGEVKFDYKQADRLKKYLSDRGKIVPRRVAGTCAKHQRLLTTMIKRARIMALLPFVSYERDRKDFR